MVQDDAATVPRSGSTNHVDGTERTADVGSPNRDVGGPVESRSQCITRGNERSSHPDSVPDDYESSIDMYKMTVGQESAQNL